MPMIVPVIFAGISYAIFQYDYIIAIGGVCEIIGLIMFFHNLVYFSMIDVIAFCAKNNFEVKKGNKIYVQKLYKRQYYMTLWEFIRSFHSLIEDHNRELEAICDSMDNDSCRFEDEVVYYKDFSGRLVELGFEADEDNQNHYHLDKDLFCWSYPVDLPQGKSRVTDKQQKRILQKIEAFLRSKSISFD